MAEFWQVKLDESAYRRLKAKQRKSGKTLSEIVNEAVVAFVAQGKPLTRERKRQMTFKPTPWVREQIELADNRSELVRDALEESLENLP